MIVASDCYDDGDRIGEYLYWNDKWFVATDPIDLPMPASFNPLRERSDGNGRLAFRDNDLIAGYEFHSGRWYSD